MRLMLKDRVVVLVATDAADAQMLQALSDAYDGHALHLARSGPKGAALHDLGPRADACREPLNIHSRMTDERLLPIGNLAWTPFDLHGAAYASVEGFWQGLKFPADADRRRIACLSGMQAKRAGADAPAVESFVYRGETIAVGRHGHWALMREACAAKFAQNDLARQALLATGSRPLTHRMRRDSVTIPGAILAEIWMDIRARLQAPERDAANAESAGRQGPRGAETQSES